MCIFSPVCLVAHGRRERSRIDKPRQIAHGLNGECGFTCASVSPHDEDEQDGVQVQSHCSDRAGEHIPHLSHLDRKPKIRSCLHARGPNQILLNQQPRLHQPERHTGNQTH